MSTYRVSVTRQHDRMEDLPGGERVNVTTASVGGTEQLGFYLQFRGEPEKVVKMLELMAVVAAEMLPAGRYNDER